MKKTIIIICTSLLLSCSSDIGSTSSDKITTTITVSTLEINNAQESAKALFTEVPSDQSIDYEAYPYEEAANILEENLQYVVTNDIYALLKEKGYSEDLGDALYDYCMDTSFSSIVDKYEITEAEL